MTESGCFVRYRAFNTVSVIYFPNLSQYHIWKAEMEATQVKSFEVLEVIE